MLSLAMEVRTQYPFIILSWSVLAINISTSNEKWLPEGSRASHGSVFAGTHHFPERLVVEMRLMSGARHLTAASIWWTWFHQQFILLKSSLERALSVY